MRMLGFFLVMVILAFGLAMVSGCAPVEQPGTGRALQMVPVCIVGCTAVYERSAGGDLGDVSLSSDRRVKR